MDNNLAVVEAPQAPDMNAQMIALMTEAFKNAQNGTPVKEKQISHETVEADVENIVIPRGMSKLDAAEELTRQHEEEETEIDLIQEFQNYMPDDVFVAVKKVCEKMFGWVNAKAQYSFFGKINPKEIQVQIDLVNNRPKYETCFFGKFGVSAWDNGSGLMGVNDNNVAHVKFVIKKKFKNRANEFFKAVTEHLKEHSIYKGKCLKFEDNKFFFIEANKAPNIVLNEKEEKVLFNFVINSLGAPGKTTVLFDGPYGTGKTETAIRIGAEAADLHITFVYCKTPDRFAYLLNLMKNYQPAIIFLEDVDNIGGGDDRDTAMNDLLNTLDGIETKGQSLMTIFTTNHSKRINHALRRPGRIDLIVKFDVCEVDTIAKIYRKYFENLPGGKVLNYEALADKSPRIQGAVIAETCKRAIKLADVSNNGEVTDDIVEAAQISLEYQIEFMKEDIEETETAEHKIVHNLVDLIAEQTESASIASGVKALRNRFEV